MSMRLRIILFVIFALLVWLRTPPPILVTRGEPAQVRHLVGPGPDGGGGERGR